MDYKSRTYNPLEAVIIRGRVVIIEGGVDYNPVEAVIIRGESIITSTSADYNPAHN